jgi:hypothetical protein
MKKILTFFSLVLISFSAQATHNRAGEILYKRIAPFTSGVGSATVQVYTYSITVIKYTDHGSNVADRCQDTVYFGDGQKGVALRVNGIVSNTCNCSAIPCGSIIINDPGYIVKKNEYSIIHTYAGPGSYSLRSSDLNRNGGVRNIPNSINTPFTLESILVINSLTGANSSPILTSAPIGQATLNSCFFHNPGAVDADGDSLSFEVTNCLGANGAAPGYYQPSLEGGIYSIGPTTGFLSWCSPLFLDQYNVAFLIKEWRKNTSGVYQFNGQVMRDMQILVKQGIVGISKNDGKTGVEISPNPVSSQVKMSLGTANVSELECVILDLTGKTVFFKKAVNVSNEIYFDISELSKGIYVFRANIDGAIEYRKIVKE